jgi:hypothetical protein
MNEITFFSTKTSDNILGPITEEEKASTKDKWLRKKYMGVWSRESIQMTAIIPRFPRRVTTYTTRNVTKRTTWIWKDFVKPMKTNSVTIV